MAKDKEVYWFKFEPKRYLTGNIQYCSLESQGLFVNVQCFYFMRECEMTNDELYRKFKDNTSLIDELIKEKVIKISGNKVVIDFLIDQHESISVKTEKLSAAGREGARIAHENRKKKQNSNQLSIPDYVPAAEKKKEEKPSGFFFYIGMKLFKYRVSKYVTEELQITINEFMPSMAPIQLEQVLKQMDIENAGMNFNDENHLRNTFKSVARILKAKSVQQNLSTDTKASVSKRPDINK